MHWPTSWLLAVQVRLACTAEVSPECIFQGIQLSEGEEEGSRILMDDLGIAAVSQTDRQTDRHTETDAQSS